MIFMSAIVIAIFGFLFLVSTKLHSPVRNQEQSDSLQADRRVIDSMRIRSSVIEDSLSLMKIENERLKLNASRDSAFFRKDSTRTR
jgi:hypothetical protein